MTSSPGAGRHPGVPRDNTRPLRGERRRSRELSQARAQIRGGEPAPSRRCQRGSATHSPAPARAPHPRTILAPPPACASRDRTYPRPAAPLARLQHQQRHATPHETGFRPMQARNNSGEHPLIPAGRKAACRARLACYRTATQRATQHSGNSRNNIRILSVTLGGAMGIRTPDLLHAMKSAPSPPPALTRRDQPKQQHRATRSDAEQRPPTLICYPDRYPGHARSALPWHRPRRTLAALAMQA